MYRLIILSTTILASLAVRAEAIEMFTNFHNGENIGFPPMQVPIGVYGGWGRGGWNPNAEGMPLKTWPPVPSMTPTGQIPGGFHRFNNGASNGKGSNSNTTNATSSQTSSYKAGPKFAGPSASAAYNSERDNFGGAKKGDFNGSEFDGSGSLVHVSSRNGFGQTLVSDRRHNNRWQREYNFVPENSENSPQNAGTARDEKKPNGISRQKLEPALESPPTPTVLHAVEGKPPISSDADQETGG
ncbi:MAG TPA: hypothetical protein VMJ32_05575 [Pirellulales bacterium]|nr:hypothetical protein [Pirellulales bacterium]